MPSWYGTDVHVLKMVFGTVGASVAFAYVFVELSAFLNPPLIPAPKAEKE